MTKLHPKEADTKAGIKRILAKLGWWSWMPVASHGFGTNGASDHHALKRIGGRGVFLSIEAKHTEKVGSANQEIFGKHVSDNGGYYRVVNLAQVEDGSFEEWLRSLEAELTF